MKTIIKLFAIISLIFNFDIQAQTYVNASATGLNDGTSWANAYTNLSTAIQNTTSGEIWVAAGTYKPSLDKSGAVPVDPRDKTFPLKNNVAIYGGFNGTETLLSQRNWNTNKTILSGDYDNNNTISADAYHIVFSDHNDATAILDGFCITNAGTGTAAWPDTKGMGGGIFVDGSVTSASPVFRNLKIFGNMANTGAAICYYTQTGGNITVNLENSFLYSNRSNCSGGAGPNNPLNGSIVCFAPVVYLLHGATATISGNVKNCSFIENYSSFGTQLLTIISNGGLTTNCTVLHSNSIFYNPDFYTNTAAAVNLAASNFQNCIIQNLSYPTCINTNPLILDLDGVDNILGTVDDNPTLMRCSPAIDAGNNTLVSASNDFLNQTRIQDGNIDASSDVDLGCAEFIYYAPRPIIYVKSNATGANNGTSWADAFTDLQSAINVADCQSQIWVAKGTYKPTNTLNKNISFNVKNYVDWYGGFNGSESALNERNWLVNQSIITGDLLGDDNVVSFGNYNENAYSAILVSSLVDTSILDGFYIQGSVQGGGGKAMMVYPKNGNPTALQMKNINFRYNQGSGLSIYSDYSKVFIDMDSCVFEKSYLNNIIGLSSNSGGSKIKFKLDHSFWDVVNLITINNGSNLNDTIQILNSSFTRFSTGIINNSYGSGETRLNIENCLFTNGNTNSLLRNVSQSSSKNTTNFINCTVTGLNLGATSIFFQQQSGTSTNTVNVTNSIVFQNTASLITTSGTTTFNVNYSDVQGYAGPGTGNIDADPKFLQPSTAPEFNYNRSDYHLTGSSPCINAGNNAFATLSVDLEGSTRIQNTTIDMGCYEAGNCNFAGTRMYVNKLATGLNNGSDWANAFTELRTALDEANKCNGITEIWVAAGTYIPSLTDSTQGFWLRNNLAIYGGFNGTETLLSQRNPTTNVTILSGDRNGNDTRNIATWTFGNYTDNIYHVVVAKNVNETAILDGFFIQSGQYNNIACHYSNPNISNNTIRWSNQYGVQWQKMNAATTLSGLTVEENFLHGLAHFTTQGIYNHVISNSTFNKRNFYGILWSGLTSLKLDNCTFQNGNNFAAWFSNSDSILIQNCKIQNNLANGISITNCSKTGIYNCVFFSNVSTTGSGGGVNLSNCTSKIINCLFQNNSVYGQTNNGNAIYQTGGVLTVDSCKFITNGNQYSFGNGGAMATSIEVTGISIFNLKNSELRDNFHFSALIRMTPNNLHAEIENCKIINNRDAFNYCSCSSGYFGGIFLNGSSVGNNLLKITNCLINNSGRITSYSAGANVGNIDIVLRNNTLDGLNFNIFSSTHPINLKATNNIFTGTISTPNTTTDYRYNCYTLGTLTGIGNINVNPQFVSNSFSSGSILDGNFRLLSTSPCLNAGINDSVFVSKDLDGQTRIQANVDMGCYESSNNPIDTVGKVRSLMSSFSGTQSFSMPYTSTTNIKNKFTVEFWARPTATHEIDGENTAGFDGVTGQKYIMFPNWTNTTAAGFGISLGTNGIAVYEHAAGYMPCLLSYSADLSDWHHYAIVYEHGVSAPKLYLDGVLVKTGIVSLRSDIFLSTDIGGGAYGFYEGFLDEIAIWDTVLSQDRIREKMHLTKLTAERNLVAYYQFNETTAKDHVKGLSSTVSGSMNWLASEVPVAFGTSQKMNVVGAGNYNFSQANTQINFANPTTPNGEIWTYNLQETPHGYASVGLPVDDEYWVVRNFGSNSTFTQLNNITFNNVNSIAAADVVTPSKIKLYKRNSNDYGATWNPQASASSLTAGANGTAVFGVSNGITSFSQFVIVSTGNSSLPVEYEYFTANRQDHEHAILHWKTASEKNNQGFEIYRKLDNETEFTKVGFVSASQNKVYSFSDNNDYEGITYYQLKQIDLNGNFNLSEMREVFGWETFEVKIYPNPNNGKFKIQSSKSLETNILIYNAEGKKVFDSGKILFQETELELNLPAGLYVLELQSNGSIQRQKISIQK